MTVYLRWPSGFVLKSEDSQLWTRDNIVCHPEMPWVKVYCSPMRSYWGFVKGPAMAGAWGQSVCRISGDVPVSLQGADVYVVRTGTIGGTISTNYCWIDAATANAIPGPRPTELWPPREVHLPDFFRIGHKLTQDQFSPSSPLTLDELKEALAKTIDTISLPKARFNAEGGIIGGE